MSRRRWQVLRALRVLIACALLAFSAAPSTSVRVWSETAALVVVSSAPLSEAAGLQAPCARRQVSRRLDTPSVDAPLAREVEPPNTPRDLVLIGDRYLRNCALLC